MLKENQNLRLSGLLFSLILTITAFYIAKPARGETTQLATPSPEVSLEKPPDTMPGVSPNDTNSSGGNDTQLVEQSGSQPTPPENQPQLSETQPPPETQPPTETQPPEAKPPTETQPQPSESPTPEQSPAETPSFSLPETPKPDSEQPTPAEEARVLVGEIVVTGADPQLENLVYNTIRTKPGRTTTRSQLQEDVNAIYATGYFSNVKVVPEDTPLGVRISFVVQPNPIFKDVAIETIPATEKQRILPQEVVNDIFKEQYGKILNLRDLQEGIKKINEWYNKNGYDLAQVIGSPKINEDGEVNLVIAEGVIEKIQVRYFNTEQETVKGKTREFIVTREMQLKPGDVFNRNTAQTDLQRVYGLGLFEDIRLNFEPGEDPKEVIINVDVVEGNTGSLAAGAGISTTSGIFGTVSYQQQNLGGNHQTIGTEFQLGERELLFDVNFSDPWIGGDPFRTAYSANLFRRRTISLVFDGDNSNIDTANGGDSPRVVRTGGGITFVRPLAKDVFSKPDWVLSASFLYQNVRIENANGEISPRSQPSDGSQLLSFSPSGVDDIWSLTFAASQDFRDNALKPTKGYVFRVGMEQTAPIGSGSIFFNRLRGNYSYYMPLKLLNFDFMQGPQTLAFNVQAGTVLGDLPPYEAFVLGGSNSVRGYAEGEVGSGRSYFQATAEYRFPIFSVVNGALFIDYGSTLGSQNAVPGKPGEVRGLPGDGLGYGLGVRIQSPVGPLRIDYGFNDQGGSRLHFGIGERF